MKKLNFIVMLLALMFASLACNLSSRSTPEIAETIPVTTEAVGSLLDKLHAAEEQARSGGEVELVITEAEVTSLMAFELQKEQPQMISDLQIRLRDGQVQIKGTYKDGDLSLPLEVVAKPEVSAEGNFRIILDSAKIGPVAAPDILRNQIQALLDEQITSSLDLAGQEYIVTSVNIADGLMTIRGRMP
jgi:uncharacterized protein YpmS